MFIMDYYQGKCGSCHWRQQDCTATTQTTDTPASRSRAVIGVCVCVCHACSHRWMLTGFHWFIWGVGEGLQTVWVKGLQLDSVLLCLMSGSCLLWPSILNVYCLLYNIIKAQEAEEHMILYKYKLVVVCACVWEYMIHFNNLLYKSTIFLWTSWCLTMCLKFYKQLPHGDVTVRAGNRRFSHNMIWASRCFHLTQNHFLFTKKN